MSSRKKSLVHLRWVIAVLGIAAAVTCQTAGAAIVVLNLDMPLDYVAAGRAGMKIGDHHRARIFYDDTTINPKTHIVRVIHMQHWMGKWVPDEVGDSTMPMSEAWLDLGSKPYRYHYRGAAVIGDPVIVEFDDKTRRMTISRQGDGSVIVSAPYSIDPTPVRGVSLAVATAPVITMLNMTVTLDEVAPGQRSKVGDVDHVRLVYDANAMDPNTKRVKLLNMQHLINGRYFPAAPDPVMMPTNDAWLDASAIPYRLHFRASVVHGTPIIIQADENSRRLTIHPQQDPGSDLESGRYYIDPTPITGSEASAAGSAPSSARPAR